MTTREHRTELVWVVVNKRADAERIAVWGVGYLTAGICRRLRRCEAEMIERTRPGLIEILGTIEPPACVVEARGAVKVYLRPD